MGHPRPAAVTLSGDADGFLALPQRERKCRHPELGVTARASVKRVIDGDTVELELRWPVTVRLKDCWAPEVRGAESSKGRESAEFLRGLLPPGRGVVVSIASSHANDLGDLMSFSRVVGHVWIPGDDESLSQIMVGAGMAKERKDA